MRNKINYLFKKYPTLSLFGLMVLFIGMEALFTFCTKTNRPPFADAWFDKWFTYKEGQSIYFTSSLGKKDTIEIGNIYKSGEHQMYGTRSNCNMEAQVWSAYSPNLARQKFYVTLTKYSTSKSVELYLYNSFFEGTDLTNEGIFPQFASGLTTQFFPTLTLNNSAYTNVQVIEKDTTALKTTGVYKIWLAQQSGLIAFEHYPSLERWVKQ